MENSENTLENSEKHSMEFGEIQVTTKKSSSPKFGLKLGKIQKFWKNTPKNSVKYPKLRKNAYSNFELPLYFQFLNLWYLGAFFRCLLCSLGAHNLSTCDDDCDDDGNGTKTTTKVMIQPPH